MRAILIDPHNQTVTNVDHDGDYRQIHDILEIDIFTVVRLDDGQPVHNCLFVDDEGLLKDTRYFFTLPHYPQPLAGKGLILGCDDCGDTVGTTLNVDMVREQVGYVQLKVLGWDHSSKDEETAFGRMHVIRNTPVFVPWSSE